MFSVTLCHAQDGVQTPSLWHGVLLQGGFAGWPCASLFSLPASLLALFPSAPLTVASSPNVPYCLMHKLVPLSRNPFP